MSHPHQSQLTREEEQFLQAVLWEEGHLRQGPASQAARAHGLSLIRCLEPANRLSPNLHGAALNQVRQAPCPPVKWPWQEMTGDDVLRLLWERLDRAEQPTRSPANHSEAVS